MPITSYQGIYDINTIFSVFTELCSSWDNVTFEYFHHPKMKPHVHLQSFPTTLSLGITNLPSVSIDLSFLGTSLLFGTVSYARLILYFPFLPLEPTISLKSTGCFVVVCWRTVFRCQDLGARCTCCCLSVTAASFSQ